MSKGDAVFDAAIFDWDGTLADSMKTMVAAFQKALGQVGCFVSDRFIERRIGIGARNTFGDALKTAELPFSDELIDELVEQKIEAQIELAGGVKLFEGAASLLDYLHNRMEIALASMNNRKVLDVMVDKSRVRRYFEVIVTADEILKPKPDPEIFLSCAEMLNCPPEKCVVVEDSIFGVKAAKEANMKCIAITTGAYNKEELEKESPDLIVDSLREETKILNFILKQS